MRNQAKLIISVAPFICLCSCYPLAVSHEGVKRMYERISNPPLIDAAEAGNTSRVLELLEGGADVNTTNKWNDTALLYAADNGHTGTALLLIEKGADVDIQNDNYGSTALMLAAQRGNSILVRALLDRGADINPRNIHNMTALYAAAGWGNAEVVRLLLDAESEVDARGDGGHSFEDERRTPLMAAVLRARNETVGLLLQRGADVNAQSASGMTALKLAKRLHEAQTNPDWRRRFEEIIQMLKDAGAGE